MTTEELSIFESDELHELKSNVAQKSAFKASAEIRQKYRATKTLLGQGAFSQVYMFEGQKNPMDRYAVKITRKGLLDNKKLTSINEEINVVKKLGEHPHVIKFFEAVEDSDYQFIVMEYMQEGV